MIINCITPRRSYKLLLLSLIFITNFFVFSHIHSIGTVEINNMYGSDPVVKDLQSVGGEIGESVHLVGPEDPHLRRKVKKPGPNKSASK